MRIQMLVIALSAVSISFDAMAVEILKKEPQGFQMRAGQPVYVDDGKCPKGQVHRVSAGYCNRNGVCGDRVRDCVPNPN